MKYILENSNQVTFHTFLNDVFRAIDQKQRDYNWLITEADLNWCPDERLLKDIIWIDGCELTDIIEANSIQFIWGVLSGFKKDIVLDINNLDVIPCADGNENLWNSEVDIQHPLADIEIVCWDSTSTIFMSRDDELSNMYKKYYSDSNNLELQNQNVDSQINFIMKTIIESKKINDIASEQLYRLAIKIRYEVYGKDYMRVVSKYDIKAIMKELQ